MRRRTFLRNLVAAVAIPWTRVLAPSVCGPAIPEPDLAGCGFVGLLEAEMEGARQDLAHIFRDAYLPGVLAAISKDDVMKILPPGIQEHPDG